MKPRLCVLRGWTGKILEDVDAFGATLAIKHSDAFNEERPLTCVTASVDRLIMHAPLRGGHSVRLDGELTYVGRSAMEVVVRAASVARDGSPLAGTPRRRTSRSERRRGGAP